MIRSIILVLAVLVGGISTARAQSATISLDPPNLQGSVGSMVQLTVKCTNLENVSAVDVFVEFDPSVLMFVYSTPGTMWDGQFMLTITNGVIPDNSGYYSLIAATQYGVYGDYSIIVLNFFVIGDGATSFKLGSDDLYHDPPIYVSQTGFIEYEFTVDNEATFNTPLAAPTALVQSDDLGASAELPGYVDNDRLVAFSAVMPAYTGGVKLEVEVKPNTVPFDGLGTVTGLPGEAEIAINTLADGGYHWRARATLPGIVSSTWVEFDGSAGTDFSVLVPVPPPPSAIGSSDSGSSSGCGGSATVGSGAMGGFLLALLAVSLLAKR